MKLHLVAVIIISCSLNNFSAAQEKNNNAANQVMSGLNDMISIMKTKILPAMNEQKAKLVNIIEAHKEPLQKSMNNIKEKLNEHMMDAGLDIYEKSMNIVDMLQNMTTKIKRDVFDMKTNIKTTAV